MSQIAPVSPIESEGSWMNFQIPDDGERQCEAEGGQQKIGESAETVHVFAKFNMSCLQMQVEISTLKLPQNTMGTSFHSGHGIPD